MQKIYLGSNSPRRLQLLQQLHLNVEVIKAEIDETPLFAETAQDYVQRMAMQKNQHIRQNCLKNAATPLLTADTCIAAAGKILGKPQSKTEACAMLQALSGKTHHVLTAVAISNQQELLHCLQISQVSMKTLHSSEIEHYVATGEPLDKAGAYAIQGLGAVFIEKLNGSYSGVMGLPLFETAQLLAKMGLTLFEHKV